MNKFKVGDKVRVIKKSCLYYNKIGIVKRLRFYDKQIYDDNWFFNCNSLAVVVEERTICINEENLELVEEKENNMEFTLSDLTDDMIVEWKDGEKFLVISNGEVLLNNRDWNLITNYNNDLSNIRYDQFSIIKVWKITSKQGYTNLINLLTDDYISRMVYCNKIELVYDRNKPQPKKMTVQQICDELGYEVEIVKE